MVDTAVLASCSELMVPLPPLCSKGTRRRSLCIAVAGHFEETEQLASPGACPAVNTSASGLQRCFFGGPRMPNYQ